MLTTGGMTGRLDKLERAGLLRRSPDPHDRRGLRVTLTEKGLELIDEAVGAGLAVQSEGCPPSAPTGRPPGRPAARTPHRHREVGAGTPRKTARAPAPRYVRLMRVRTAGPAPSNGAVVGRQALAFALVFTLRLVTRCFSWDLSRTMTRPAMTTNSAIGSRT